MSEQDPQEHPKTYERFCAPRFKNVEDKVDSIDGKVDSIDRVVNNGLCDRMKKVENTAA